MLIQKFDQKLHKLLFSPELVPHLHDDILYNGLQIKAKSTVTKIGFGVSASLELFKMAKKYGCDGLIVHHGLDFNTPIFHTITHDRVKWLIKNEVSLWGFHFILDAHPLLGHNAQILKLLSINKSQPYSHHKQAPWGRIGQFPKPVSLEKIIKKIQPHFSSRTVVYDYGSKQIRTVVCVSGSAAPYGKEMDDLKDSKIDLYITGEAREWNREMFREAKINFIAGGHYSTETFGLKALQKIVAEKWKMKTVWLDLPNEI